VNVAFINGSPRKTGGNTAKLLRLLEQRLPGCEISHGWDSLAPLREGGAPCGAIVIAFPLYVDGIPSGLLRELAAHERDMPPGARVYVLVNNGFYEGEQNAVAVSMLRHWCARAGLAWGQGAGVAGEILAHVSLSVAGVIGLGAKCCRALDTLAGHILAGAGGEDRYAGPNFPRPLYMLCGNITFRLAGKKNGLSGKDMKRR
jgi:hypothetical protein